MTRVSHRPSSSYDLPSPPRRFSSASSTPLPTASARNSHYRPFSTLYTGSPFVEIQEEKSSSLLKRHSSIGGLQTFVHMGIGFMDKAKAKKNHDEPIEIKICTPSPPRSPPHYNVAQRPSTATNPAPTFRSLRSMASATELSTSSSPHQLLFSPPSTDITITSSSTKKRTRFLAQDHESSEKFIPKSIWAKRHNMKLHPYHQDVPYMQAYDPVLLDR